MLLEGQGYMFRQIALTNLNVAIISIVPSNELWVSVKFKESPLKYLCIGQPVELASDVYGRNVLYHRKIVGFPTTQLFPTVR